MRLDDLRAKPAPEFVDAMIRSADGNLAYEPIADKVYRSLPERGKVIQEAFYKRLGDALAEQPKTRRNSALVVTSARNEEKDIHDSVVNLVNGVDGRRGTEVAVVSNASTDGTEDEVRRAAKTLGKTVQFVDHTRGDPVPKRQPPAGVTRLHLFSESQPGKTRGLLKVRDLFEAQGSLPEWVVQVDADTSLGRGAVGKLIDTARENNAIAASGDAKKIRRDGKPLIIPEKASDGHFQHQTLAGSFAASRTLPWVKGYETILDVYPSCATEDTLLSMMYRFAGFRSRPRSESSDIDATMLAPDNNRDARKQMARWMTGARQLGHTYLTSVLQMLGMRPKLSKELRVSARGAGRAVVHPIKTVKARRAARVEERIENPPPEVNSFSDTAFARKAALVGITLGAVYDSQRNVRRLENEGTEFAWVPQR